MFAGDCQNVRRRAAVSHLELDWNLANRGLSSLVDLINFSNFTFKIYPEKNFDKASMRHMYKSMENYLLECFGPLEDNFKDDYYLAAYQLQN